LTLALPRRKECPLSLLVSAGLETVALRVPAQATARALLEASGLPIAAPSANRSGRVSPTKAEHVAADMGSDIDLILDGGATVCGIESTVIGFQCDAPILLRSGVISREEIEEVAGPLTIPSTPAISSPGQMASHYAPETALRLNATRIEPEEALLAFGAAPEHAGTVRNLSPYGDLREAAANLFAMLRELDGSGATRIAVMPIPGIGLGDAINDRLRRAAAPRDNE
jgi:L-threonylcarbamoyladenylate synthase